MSVTLDDLQPKQFKIKIKDTELTCNPPEMWHTMVLAKVGTLFQNIDKATQTEMRQAQIDLEEVIRELIPELNGIKLDTNTWLIIMQQIFDASQPNDDRELKEKGVRLNTDPKVMGTTG